MEILHLPPTLVPFLDALAHTRADHDHEREGFEAALADMRGWLEHHGVFHLHSEEALELENLGVLHEQLRNALEGASKQAILDALVPPLYQAVQLMESINRRREQPHFSPLPAVNSLIMAGAAYLQGRGQSLAVSTRLAILGEFYRTTRQRYRSLKARLRPEVSADLDVAFAHLKAGHQAAEAALAAHNREALHDALAQIKEGADLVGFLVDWERQDRERLQQRHRRFNIPHGAGAVLELGLESARCVPSSQWPRGIRALREGPLAELRAFFAASQPRLVLPLESRQELVEAVEAGLEELDSVLLAMDEPEGSPEEALAALEQALEELSQAFTELESQVPSVSHLQGTLAGAYWEAGIGSLGGTVPVVAWLELLQSHPGPPEWEPVIRHLRDYLATQESADLQLALLALAELHPPPHHATEGPESWSCPYCAQANPVGVTTCQVCAGTASSATFETWEA